MRLLGTLARAGMFALAGCAGAAPRAAAPPADAPPLPAPVPAAPLAAPGPAAAPCTDDTQCGTHRCNRPAARCAFPCATDADCLAGARCAPGAVPACLPAR